MNFWEVIFGGGRWLFLWHGLEVTLVLTVLSLILGSAIGVFVALMYTSNLRPFGRMKTSRLANFNPLASLGKIYVDIIRGTPLLVQLFGEEFFGTFSFRVIHYLSWRAIFDNLALV